MKPGRPKGLPKTGGRQPGSPNKTTRELKQWLETLINNNRENAMAAMEKLAREDSGKFLQVYERLLAYIIPRAQTTLDVKMEYIELQRLLEKTPEQYLEAITAKLIELNTKNNTDEDEDFD